MNTYAGYEIIERLSLTSELGGGEWSDSSSGCFKSHRYPLCTEQGGLQNLSGSCGVETTCSCRELKSGSPVSSNISVEHTAFIYRAEVFFPEDGSRIFAKN
jgi:hypothetical protein